MMYDKLKRSSSLGRSGTSEPCKLFWFDWAQSPFLNYLNLMDSEHKRKYFESIPWFQAPSRPSDVLKYCLRKVFAIYRTNAISQINQCNCAILPTLIRKFLYVSRLFNITFDVDETSYLYYFLAYSLLDKGCEDPSLFLDLWRTLCVSNKTKIAVLSGVIGKHRKQKTVKLLQYVMKTAHSARFDFWGAWTEGCELSDFNYCPVTAALLTGCLDQMSILLEYGFKPNLQRLSTYDNHFMIWVDYIYTWLREPLAQTVSQRRKTITEVILFLVNLARCKKLNKRVSMAKCFHLLWSIIPTPFVTVQELKSEVYLRFHHPPFYASIIYPSTEKQFMELCDYYAAVFYFDGMDVLQPRSLKHLCKCVIRSQLQKAWNLPIGIKALDLPKQLESFLHVETDL